MIFIKKYGVLFLHFERGGVLGVLHLHFRRVLGSIFTFWGGFPGPVDLDPILHHAMWKI